MLLGEIGGVGSLRIGWRRCLIRSWMVRCLTMFTVVVMMWGGAVGVVAAVAGRDEE